MALEEENVKLKGRVLRSDEHLDSEGPADNKLVTPGLRRNGATWAVAERDYAQRRARRLIAQTQRRSAMPHAAQLMPQ